MHIRKVGNNWYWYICRYNRKTGKGKSIYIRKATPEEVEDQRK